MILNIATVTVAWAVPSDVSLGHSELFSEKRLAEELLSASKFGRSPIQHWMIRLLLEVPRFEVRFMGHESSRSLAATRAPFK